LDGVAFRFIDTAGIRQTKEAIEILGIERTYEKIKSASVVILMLDSDRPEAFSGSLKQLKASIDEKSQKVIVLINKIDNISKTKDILLIKNLIVSVRNSSQELELNLLSVLPVSAKNMDGLSQLKDVLTNEYNNSSIDPNSTLVTNLRHYQALQETKSALLRVVEGIDEALPTDLLTQDIREALFHIGEIVGVINTEEILGNIFSKFCIGK
jgi:tRNA modification GTPase